MAKSAKKKIPFTDIKELKSPKEASTIFHNIMKTSVTVGLSTPKHKAAKKKNTRQ